jgi:sterol desaturase/sphingolipid hydroxylase (fatty acid hydroxylase superfamily)
MTLFADALTDWLPSTATFLKLGWGIFGFFSGKELLSYVSLSGGLVVVILLYLWARRSGTAHSLREFLAPRGLWSHASARLDAKYYLLIQPVFILLVFPLAGMAQWASAGIELGLEGWLGPSPFLVSPLWGGALYTLAVFIGVDFGFFYSHYLSHKYPLLWCFHKVHHSAEVLVPFTAMRFHPLDALWNVAFSASFATILGGLCRYGFYGEASEIKLFGNNLIIALSYVTTHNLRHMHIWLHYPRWLNRFLISPAQHQIHHSRERRHWDKNMGYLLPVWDRWFGTLYTPQGREAFALGVDGMPEAGLQSHRTMESLLIAPFLDVRDHWQRRRGRQQARLGQTHQKPLTKTLDSAET